MTASSGAQRCAVIFGATGAVGRHCLNELLASPRYGSVLSIGRRRTGITHVKLTEIATEFDQLPTVHLSTPQPIDDAFCCLGTTIAAAGSKDAFRRVDCTYPPLAARFAKAHGARQFSIVTALGADPGSSVFYNRVKGDAEAAVIAEELESTAIFRPSLLLAERAEFRWKEKLSEPVLKALAVVMLGPAAKYRPIAALTVARAMVRVAATATSGTTVYLSDEIAALGAA